MQHEHCEDGVAELVGSSFFRADPLPLLDEEGLSVFLGETFAVVTDDAHRLEFKMDALLAGCDRLLRSPLRRKRRLGADVAEAIRRGDMAWLEDLLGPRELVKHFKPVVGDPDE